MSTRAQASPLSSPRPSSRPVLCAVVILALALILPGCSGKKEPEPIPAQTATQVAPQLEPPPQLPPPVRRVRPTPVSPVKVIDPGDDDEGKPKTLYEASLLAKALEKQGGARPVAEITDENLHEYSAEAEVIILEGDPAAPAPTGEIPPPVVTGRDRDEQYWRNGALEIRMAWRRALDRIAELELESAALRQQFYAEDDPYVRDSQVKPAWDRVLDRLGELRDQSARYQQELDHFIEEGRQAGAEPGWLAEGWELEPEERQPDVVEELGVQRAMEPSTHVEVKDP